MQTHTHTHRFVDYDMMREFREKLHTQYCSFDVVVAESCALDTRARISASLGLQSDPRLCDVIWRNDSAHNCKVKARGSEPVQLLESRIEIHNKLKPYTASNYCVPEMEVSGNK